MIQMTNGTFGWRKGGRIVPITPESGPVSINPAVEKHLVSSGVAVYCSSDGSLAQPSPYAAIKSKDLKDLCKKRGIDVPSKAKVQDLIDLLDAADATGADNASNGGANAGSDSDNGSSDQGANAGSDPDNDPGDGEQPPVITPESVVS